MTLDEMEALAEVATPGPWVVGEDGPERFEVRSRHPRMGGSRLLEALEDAADAEFAAACREWVPRAVAALRQARILSTAVTTSFGPMGRSNYELAVETNAALDAVEAT